MLGNVTMQPVAVLIHDPSQPVEQALEVLEHGQPRATPWMQRLRKGSGGVRAHPVSGAPLYDGRLCCGAALRAYDGRADLEMPFDVPCPDCGRIYQVRLDLVRRR
jgi:hypothetical protein